MSIKQYQLHTLAELTRRICTHKVSQYTGQNKQLQVCWTRFHWLELQTSQHWGIPAYLPSYELNISHI